MITDAHTHSTSGIRVPYTEAHAGNESYVFGFDTEWCLHKK